MVNPRVIRIGLGEIKYIIPNEVIREESTVDGIDQAIYVGIELGDKSITEAFIQEYRVSEWSKTDFNKPSLKLESGLDYGDIIPEGRFEVRLMNERRIGFATMRFVNKYIDDLRKLNPEYDFDLCHLIGAGLHFKDIEIKIRRMLANQLVDTI